MRSILKISFAICIMAPSNGFAQSATSTASNIGIGAALAMGGNLGTGAAMASMCTPEKPQFCVLAALSFAQAGKDGGTGKTASSAGRALYSSGWETANLGSGFTGSSLDNTFLKYDEQLKGQLAALKKKAPNIDVDKGTVGTAKGSVPLSSLASGAAMAKAGLASPEDIAAIDAQLKKSEGFKMPAMTASTGGGGGGGGSSSKSAEYKMPSFEMPRDPASAPAAPVAAGLVKLANGEPIGTASDNIFNMLHNRYQQKVKERMFVGQDPVTK